jgi:single-strand DNA-binding protein
MKPIITVTGNVGKDVELKFSGAENMAVATFSLAHTPRTLTAPGEWQDGETMWFKVVTFRSKAEKIADTVQKGDSVLVVGTLKQSNYVDKEGKDRTSLEIVADEVALVVKSAPRRTSKREEDTPPW